VAKRQQEKRQSEYPGDSYYLIGHDAAAPYRFQRGEAHRRNTGVQFEASTRRVSLALKVYKEFVNLDQYRGVYKWWVISGCNSKRESESQVGGCNRNNMALLAEGERLKRPDQSDTRSRVQ
jgi:hypothetical protein